jgi:hypothetical protein
VQALAQLILAANGPLEAEDQIVRFDTAAGRGCAPRPTYRPFDVNTRSFVYSLQPRAIMLDFDYSCGRETSSAEAMIYRRPLHPKVLSEHGDAVSGVHVHKHSRGGPRVCLEFRTRYSMGFVPDLYGGKSDVTF